MCYTEQDSWFAQGINTISCILLFLFTKNKQLKVLALFLGFVGQMQLLDALFWRHTRCDSTNQAITQLAIAFNHLQPIVFLAAQSAQGIAWSPISQVLLATYLLLGGIYMIQAYRTVSCTQPKAGVMHWEWNGLAYAPLVQAIFLALFVATSMNFSTPWIRWISAGSTLLTFFVATKTPILHESLGRIWCQQASFVPLLLGVISQVA